MDAVELARRTAADLHRKAVERGLDPWQPYKFAVAEAQRRGLDVEKTASNAAVLDGGRATFIPKDELIIHVNVGSSFEQAFLVAHEIGHAELGDGLFNEPARDIDPARSAEASPVGTDRVVDYGRRQRREVQMDLFAREFLLPRNVARRLHVEDGLTASCIAERLGAPFAVVAQQLFDALLLPEILAADDADRPKRPLNIEQAAAADHRGGAFLLGAGPGTGKTQTLTSRASGLLDEGVDPRRVLVLTYSNKAAGELADRIARKRGEGAAAMWVGTFHAFGLDVVRRFHAELGLPADPRMIDRTEAAELLENEFPRLGLRHYRNIHDPTAIIGDMLDAISRAKDEVVGPEKYAELAAGMPSGPDADRASEVAHVYAAYETLKSRANCIDFGDLVSMPVWLLEENPKIRTYFQGRYEHLLVDEYQDVNRASVRLLKVLSPDGRNLWAVGDAKQSIYRFRGASSFNMGLFGTKDFPGAAGGKLETNYRSTPEVVDAFSRFATDMRAGGRDSGLQADRPEGGHPPQLRVFATRESESAALADAIEEMRRDGHAYRDQAILCTGNEKLTNIARELERFGIPVLFLGSLFERPEVKDLLSLLSILADPRAPGLVRIACLPGIAMSLPDVAAAFEHLRSADGDTSWLDDVDAVQGVSPGGLAALGELRRVLHGFDPTSQPWNVLASFLLDRTRMAAGIATGDSVADRARGIAVWQFMNFLRVQPAMPGLPVARLLDRIRRLVRLGGDRDLRQLPEAARGIDAVRLMTIHGAKGLEFPVVHMPGMNSDAMPRSFKPPSCPPPDGMLDGGYGTAAVVLKDAHIEEQECLFYVAVSRARDRLLLYAAATKTNGPPRTLSPFLSRIGSGLVQRLPVHRLPLPVAPESEAIDLVIDGRLRLGAPTLSVYEKCPRRFFYTYVLQIGGRRTATAYMQMHEAVRSVVQCLVAGGTLPPMADLDTRVAEALHVQGLTGHGYFGEFQELALAMVAYFVAGRTGHSHEVPAELLLTFRDDDVVMIPDDVLVRSDGVRLFRRVRTGHHRSADEKDAGTDALMLAAARSTPGTIVELMYLADETPQRFKLDLRKATVRHEKLETLLGSIRAGRFPANPSEHRCPKCPAFFVCGPTPKGTLNKNF